MNLPGMKPKLPDTRYASYQRQAQILVPNRREAPGRLCKQPIGCPHCTDRRRNVVDLLSMPVYDDSWSQRSSQQHEPIRWATICRTWV